ncbi:MAG TPA: PilZ domain-containing protein [Myxococcales bacterium]|nr:PilZ domain-containing protein [Myxococcales bacterium]
MSSTLPLVIPIRFSGGGLTMQTTTSRIGAESVFVRSLISPKEGSRVVMSLSLPGSARPLDATGTVAARGIEAAKDHGFWVRFDPLSEEARSFLEVVLRSKGVASPPRQAQRAAAPRADGGRAYARVPARVRVGWKTSREFLVAHSENISRGGIFIASDNPPPLREVLELSLDLPDGKGPVKTHAEVVHRVTPEEARASGRKAGAGLQFVGANDDFRQRLDACVAALLAQER